MHNLKAVGIGQHDVEQHRVGHAAGNSGLELAVAAKALGLDALLAQCVQREPANVVVILNVIDHCDLPLPNGFFHHTQRMYASSAPAAKWPNRKRPAIVRSTRYDRPASSKATGQIVLGALVLRRAEQLRSRAVLDQFAQQEECDRI